MDDLVWTPLTDLARMIASKQVSPVEVVSAHLDRIDKLDAKLRAFITVMRKSALAAAQAAEARVLAGDQLGPLHGVPIGLKDLYNTKDAATTGGSIRIPAALCGITGIKPTYGRVSRAGVLPLAWSLDHVGPMARSAADCALMLGAMAGPDPKDPTSSTQVVPDYVGALSGDIRGLRVGVLRSFFLESAGVVLR